MTHDAESFLRDFHAQRPGCTPRAFAAMRTAHGRSSYDVLADRVRPGELVVDLACGDGFLLQRVLDRGAEGVGVDMSASELAAARERLRGRATLHEARAQQLPLPDGSVDRVLCHMAFMLMAPIEPVVAEIRRVLRPGGEFAAVVGGGEAIGGWGTFVARLREVPFERGVRIGDRRTRDVEGLRALLGPDAEVDRLEMRWDSDIDGLWAFFSDSYDLPMMSPEAVAQLRAAVRADLPDHPVPCGTTLLLVRSRPADPWQ